MHKQTLKDLRSLLRAVAALQGTPMKQTPLEMAHRIGTVEGCAAIVGIDLEVYEKEATCTPAEPSLT